MLSEQIIYRSWRENFYFLMRYKCGRCGNIQRIAQLRQAFFSKDDSKNHTCLKCGYDGFLELPIKDEDKN